MKIFRMILCATLLIVLGLALSINTHAAGATEGEYWRFENGCLTITGKNPIPNISKSPWAHLQNEITSVVVESGPTLMSDHAFYDCDRLQSVTLPDTLLNIGNYAFWDCDNLREVNMQEGITKIGKQAFYSFNALSYISLPSTVTSIGNGAFSS